MRRDQARIPMSGAIESMEPTFEENLIWPRSKSLGAKTLPRCSRIIKNQRKRLKVFSVGSPDLDRVLAGLPNLLLQKKCRIVKSEEKIVVVRLPLKIDGKIKSVYVKQHNAGSFARRLASVVYPSAAMRSLSGAAALLQRGFVTAPPIAAVEQRFWGVLIKSFYISEEIPGAKTVETFWRGELGAWRGVAGYVKRRLFLRALARLFKSLHDNSIYHNDLKSANILVVGRPAASETMFGLIDLQGLRECFFVSARRRIKNFAQLNRTLGVHLTRSERLFFLHAYGDYPLLDRRARRALVSGILKQTHRQISREKLRHHAEEKYPCLEVAS